MDKGYVDGSRNCAGATNLRAGARVRSHLGLSKWHRDSVPYHHMSCLSLSLRSVSAQGRYMCCVPVSAQGQCACPVPVTSFCQCTWTVRLLSVPVSSFCQCSTLTHSCTIGTAQCCQLKAPLTFRHHASYTQDRRTAPPQSLFSVALRPNAGHGLLIFEVS